MANELIGREEWVSDNGKWKVVVRAHLVIPHGYVSIDRIVKQWHPIKKDFLVVPRSRIPKFVLDEASEMESRLKYLSKAN